MAFPSNCLICYGARPSSKLGNSSNSQTWSELSSTSALNNHLQVFFILRNVLEVPRTHLQRYLHHGGGRSLPDEWIWICADCNDGFVKDAKKIHEDMVSAAERFRTVKKQVIDKIMGSSESDKKKHGRSRKRGLEGMTITEESRSFVIKHDYNLLTGDPFQEGDGKAMELVKRMQEGTEDVIVKVEPEDLFEHDDNARITAEVGDTLERCLAQGNLSHDKESQLVEGARTKTTRNARSSTLRCSRCSRTFSNQTLLDGHLHLHDSKTAHHCQINGCNRVFEYWYYLRHHQIKCHRSQIAVKPRVWKTRKCKNCDSCDLSFPPEHFDKHLLYFHGDKDGRREKEAEKEPAPSAVSTSPLKCNICLGSRPFPSENDLQSHLKLHKTSFMHCFQCLTVHRSTAHLQRHISRRHPETISMDEVGQQAPHQKPASPRVSWSCSVCKKEFIDEGSLDAHMSNSHKVNKNQDQDCSLLECKFCDEKFSSKLHRKLHYRQHFKDGVRPFKCNLCGRNFQLEHHLKSHMNSHEKLKQSGRSEPRLDFECRHCGKEFSYWKYLERHEQTHLPPDQRIKSHICEKCGKAFGSQDNLKRHMKRHDVNLGLQCSFCDKKFRHRQDHRDHEDIHRNAGTKPYMCHLCGKGFAMRKYLRVHVKKPHFQNKVPKERKNKKQKIARV